MEKLLDKQVTGRGKSATVQYLVMWKGWDPVHNQWYSLKDLDKATDLMAEYDKLYGLRSQKQFRKGKCVGSEGVGRSL